MATLECRGFTCHGVTEDGYILLDIEEVLIPKNYEDENYNENGFIENLLLERMSPSQIIDFAGGIDGLFNGFDEEAEEMLVNFLNREYKKSIIKKQFSNLIEGCKEIGIEPKDVLELICPNPIRFSFSHRPWDYIEEELQDKSFKEISEAKLKLEELILEKI